MNQENRTNEEILWPNKVDITYVWLTSIWSIISGFLGWVFIFIAIFFMLQRIDIVWWIYAFIFSIVWLFATIIVSSFNLFLNSLIFPTKYKRWSVIFTQNIIFSIFLYVFITPLYMYLWWLEAKNLIYVFMIHTILGIFGTSVIAEILSSYRYILIWIYGSFFWLFLSVIITAIILIQTHWEVHIYSLVWMIVVINFSINLIRWLFEYLYYKFYSISWFDWLGDIFYQIEKEEQEELEKAKKELETFK